MGTWQVPADVLATSGFGTSPKAEIVGALGALTRPRSPEQRAFGAAHGAAFAAWLDDHPIATDLIRASFRESSPGDSGWIADYLAQPADTPDPTLDHEISLLGRLTDDDLRGDLTRPHAPPSLEACSSRASATPLSISCDCSGYTLSKRTGHDESGSFAPTSSPAPHSSPGKVGLSCCATSDAIANGSAMGTCGSTDSTSLPAFCPHGPS